MPIGLPKAIVSSALRFDIPAVRLFIEDVLDSTVAEVRQDFLKTTQTWTNHKPDFIIEKRPYFRRVYTVDEIYAYLNFGTRVRHALMSPDFLPKTEPGVIGSKPGAGGVVRVSRLLELPGIKARKFDMAIQKRAQQKLIQRTARGVFDAVRKRI